MLSPPPSRTSVHSPSENAGSLLLHFSGTLQELLSLFWSVVVTCAEKELFEAVNALRVTDQSTYTSLGLLTEA